MAFICTHSQQPFASACAQILSNSFFLAWWSPRGCYWELGKECEGNGWRTNSPELRAGVSFTTTRHACCSEGASSANFIKQLGQPLLCQWHSSSRTSESRSNCNCDDRCDDDGDNMILMQVDFVCNLLWHFVNLV